MVPSNYHATVEHRDVATLLTTGAQPVIMPSMNRQPGSTNADWVNFGKVDTTVLAAFDAIRSPKVGRGTFLAVIARSTAGKAADLTPYTGDTNNPRTAFGRVRTPEYDRTAKGQMPAGVTRTGFLRAMIDVAKQEGLVWHPSAR